MTADVCFKSKEYTLGVLPLSLHMTSDVCFKSKGYTLGVLPLSLIVYI